MTQFTNTITDFVIIFTMATIVVILFHYLKQPSISGFIFTGALIGPTGLRLVNNSTLIQVLSEIGVILVMFSLGVEFSISRIKSMARLFLGLGALQCILTTIVTTVIFYLLGNDVLVSFIIGTMISLSSTAIVIKILQHKREVNTPQGNASIAILLFQDLWIVPILIMIPFLKDLKNTDIANEISEKFFLGFLLFSGVIFASRYVVPVILRSVARTEIRELFIALIGLLSLGTALISHEMGLSLALGAFLGGVIISQSEFGHQAVAEVIPLRDLFIAIFFISIGMLLDISFLTANLWQVILVAMLIIFVKFIITATSASLIGLDPKTSAISGMMLAQIGEFSFVIGEQGRHAGILTTQHYQFLLSITLILMALTPFFINWAPRLAPVLSTVSPFRRRTKFFNPINTASEPLIDHVIIVGFGVNGQLLAEQFKKNNIRYCIIELNHTNYLQHKKNEFHIVLGDASKKEILEAAGIESARLIILAINDNLFIQQTLSQIHKLRPDIPTITRVFFSKEAQILEKKFKNQTQFVVTEIEGGKALIRQALLQLEIPAESISE